MDLRTQIRVSVRAYKMGLLQAQFVSIHARPCGPGDATRRNCGRVAQVFQSTPAFAGGRWSYGKPDQLSVPGFNPRPPLRAGDVIDFETDPFVHGVSIHARPCGRAMLQGTDWSNPSELFQSTPALAGGRWSRCPPNGCATARFNPRPPLRAGDEMRLQAELEFIQFQSTPALAGGRCLPIHRTGGP